MSSDTRALRPFLVANKPDRTWDKYVEVPMLSITTIIHALLRPLTPWCAP